MRGRKTRNRVGIGVRDALIGGMAGAAALTTVHQAALGLVSRPPRMDRVGMRAIARGMHALGGDPPRGRKLYGLTLAGDLAANAAYYALAGLSRRRPVAAATALGLAAGIGALALPRRLGLDDPPHSDAADNQAMTIAWYTIGGITAGAVMAALGRRRTRPSATPRRIARIRTPSAEWRRAEDL